MNISIYFFFIISQTNSNLCQYITFKFPFTYTDVYSLCVSPFFTVKNFMGDLDKIIQIISGFLPLKLMLVLCLFRGWHLLRIYIYFFFTSSNYFLLLILDKVFS